MEIGSVLELDSWELYRIPEEKKAFWLPFMKENKEYKSVLYQSGRNAIEDLLLFLKKEKGIQKVLMPDYMCTTVNDAGKRAGMSLCKYHVYKDYSFSVEEIQEKIAQDTCLFIAHYFGRKIDKDIISAVHEWKKQGIIVIEDITLSLFSKDETGGIGFGTYTLGSIRKWLPIPDGGFLASVTDDLPQEKEETFISKYSDFYMLVQTMKKEYIQGGCKNKTLKKIYMDYYARSIHELFSDYKIYPVSDWSRNYLQNFDLEKVINKRTENYDYLYKQIANIEGLDVKVHRETGYLPFGMVIQVEDRDELLKYLIGNDIYCNVHWRLDNSEDNPEIEYMSTHSITVPCDQRYDYEDLDRIAKALREWVDK